LAVHSEPDKMWIEICERRSGKRHVQNLVSVLVIHIQPRESVFMITSNTEAVEVV